MTTPQAHDPAAASEATTDRVSPAIVDDLRGRVAAQFDDLVEVLKDLVRIPSISNADFDQNEVARSAEFTAELLRNAGIDDVEVRSVVLANGRPGAPAIIARKPAPAGAPTVMLYAHHDVQPVGDLAEWQTDPFEPTRRGERLFGRGAADDKAGIVAHLGALRALGDDLPVGIVLFIEGEEEVGSPSFVDFLHAYQADLAADVIVVADSSNWQVGIPGLTTTLRGVIDCTVEVAVLDHAIHSGFFGGPVLDAATLLARLVATLHDENGDVAVAGLVRGPDPLVDYDESDFRTDTGVLDGVQLAGTGPISARLWTRPALAVIGWDSPRITGASNTVTAKATAKLSLRIPPGQEPQAALDALTQHLLERAPFGAQVTVTPGELGRSFSTPADSEAMRTARWAFAQSWGVPPVDIGIGGSIPFIADLVEVFPAASILVTGVEDPDSRAHGANESVHLGDLQHVVLAEALLLTALGAAVR